MSSESNQLPNIKANTEQILNDIQSLQNIEKQLFSSLDLKSNLTAQQQQDILEKINSISKMRVNLYQTINGINSYFQSALYNSRGTLNEQAAAIQIVENELNNSKKKLKSLEEAKNNKVRLIEINEYYGDKYAEHSSLLKILIYALIPIIIVTYIYNIGFLPNYIYYIIIIIISIIFAIFFWYKLWSIWNRDRMNYQAYDWGFNENDITPNTTNPNDPWKSNNLSFGTCIGDSCCSTGMVYDNSSNQCIIQPFTQSDNNSPIQLDVTQNLSQNTVTNVLTQKIPINIKPDVTLGSDSIMPNYSSSMNFNSF